MPQNKPHDLKDLPINKHTTQRIRTLDGLQYFTVQWNVCTICPSMFNICRPLVHLTTNVCRKHLLMPRRNERVYIHTYTSAIRGGVSREHSQCLYRDQDQLPPYASHAVLYIDVSPFSESRHPCSELKAFSEGRVCGDCT